jgi:hypothetical protein
MVVPTTLSFAGAIASELSESARELTDSIFRLKPEATGNRTDPRQFSCTDYVYS